MDFREFLKNNTVIFDGAMGTQLQEKGLVAGRLPELMNITHKEIVTDIHKAFVAAGCDVVTTNTFGANEIKLKESGYTVAQIVNAAVKNAREANPKFVALDVGPIGQLMEPVGTLNFEQAVDIFKNQMSAGAAAGADLIIIETISDLYEAKAAIIAAKECCDLPILCTMTFGEDGRTFMGTDPVTCAVTLSALGADAIGINCSLGPDGILPYVEEMLKYSRKPIIVQANAGLPREENGKTVYDITPEEFAEFAIKFYEAGVRLIGGCCGTTPLHIGAVKEKLQGKSLKNVSYLSVTACTSGGKTAFIGGGTVIGERINPTGKKRLKEALRNSEWDYILSEAVAQTKAGSDVLDINCGLPEINEKQVLCDCVKRVREVSILPLQIDSSDPEAIEAAVRIYAGKPIINSVNGSSESMSAIFPIAKKYGALMVGLTLDEKGIPQKAKERFAIAERIISTAENYGIPKEDIIIDCLVLTASAQQQEVMETLKAIGLVKANLGVKTVLGVSNVSFGLPAREVLNSTFLAAGFGAGLDSAIINPLSENMMKTVDAFRVLNATDKDSAKFIEKYAAAPSVPQVKTADGTLSLTELIIDGKKKQAQEETCRLLLTESPIDIVNRYFIPALDTVGTRFERGEIFLPQLMQSAEAVQAGFKPVKEKMEQNGETASKGKIILATVKGDIHDIGKNIAKMLLENYGYQCIDLGKDVAPEKITRYAVDENIKLVGLSALMTTTVKNMKETVALLRQECPDCKVMVGGAVLNKEYAEDVGADFYVKDARDGVKVADKVFGN